MFVLIVVAYLLLASALVGLWLFPEPRQHLIGWARRLTRQLHNAMQRLLNGGRGGVQQAQQRTAAAAGWLQQRATLIAATAGLVLLPALLILLWRGVHTFDPLEPDALDPQSQVAQLLRGEQLVPPPPLPPEVFTRAEIEESRPQLSTADRRWDLLDHDFQQRLLMVFKLMREEHGYEMVLLEGYRSPERQAMLQGLGPHVTNAAAFQSFHQYGLAADCAFLRNGRVVISEKDPWAQRGYELYGQAAERLGLRWGGRWQMLDLGHVELPRAGTLGKKP
ncbi:M15 family metallopeptidase [Methylibium rhizosphaerae]|uniref:M15 family metallopeptidase n=1 Tax=Methylibium rhizosphaerae TaxID=2570323 RepID=UPI003CCC779A